MLGWEKRRESGRGGGGDLTQDLRVEEGGEGGGGTLPLSD